MLALARRVLLGGVLIALFAACPSKKTTTKKTTTTTKKTPAMTGVQTGYATWYGGAHHGGPTASGEKYNKRAMTAAHRTLRMNTRVKVTNTRNGRSVILRINDRGPYANKARIIDVSEAAAEILGMIEAGVVPVVVEIVK